MRYVINNSTDTHFNMAFDEFVLQGLGNEDPVFYLWQNRPSVIIGLNQSAYAEVNLQYLDEKGITLARRVTGGGAVYHDLQNLNYSIAGKSSELEGQYPEYMYMMTNALRELGIPAVLSGRNDILVDGRKCSGYAKRMYKDRILIHGTLMFDVDLEEMTRALSTPGSKLSSAGIASVRSRVANLREFLPGCKDIYEFRDALHGILLNTHSAGCTGDDTEIVLGEEQLRSINEEADTKFRTWEWNYGHSPKSDFNVRKKFSCGSVQAAFSIASGCIRDLSFGGDFLGNRPSSELLPYLEGVRFENTAVLGALQKAREDGVFVDECFDSLSDGELAGLILDI